MTYPQNFTTPEQKEQFDKLFEFCKSLPAKYKFQYLATEKYSDTYSITYAVFDLPGVEVLQNGTLYLHPLTDDVETSFMDYCDANSCYWCESCQLKEFKQYQQYPDSRIRPEDWIINS